MNKSSPSRFLTLQELCSLLGISKATFYKHQRHGVFPEPMRTAGGRLVFDQSLIEACQQVVLTRTGINGEPVIFRTRQRGKAQASKTAAPPAGIRVDHLVESLASLGLAATPQQVDRATLQLLADLAEPELIRRLFLLLRQQG
jgi:predicted DNA-binding transcriptional regulator AlpA